MKHIEHIEDNILNYGVEGAKDSLTCLRNICDMLVNGRALTGVTVKWDGAPSIFAGIDPSDKRFFVATKSFFNKNAKIYKSASSIDDDTIDAGLKHKLKLALEEFAKLGIEGVIQGDFLYSSEDLRQVVIDGESYITFHPNTIVYAIPKNSDAAHEILASRIGVVWHTAYRGDTLESMLPSFGEEIASRLEKNQSVWSIDVRYHGDESSVYSGDDIVELLLKANTALSKVRHETLERMSRNSELIVRIKAFINSKIRVGERITNSSTFVEDLSKYISDYYQKEIDQKMTDKSKAIWIAKRNEAMKCFMGDSKIDMITVFDIYSYIVDAKHTIVQRLNGRKQIGTFLKTADGYRVTEHEGFVAIDHTSKSVVKLVDRLQFSHANFSTDIQKGWQR